MRKLFILCFFIPFLGFSQIIVGEWITEKVIGEDFDNKEFYLFRDIHCLKTDQCRIIFKEDNTFETHYYSPDQSRCLFFSKGTYEIINHIFIKIHIETISQKGNCEKFEKVINKDFGIFQIRKFSENNIKLIKVAVTNYKTKK